jgi:hypothetical protein
MIPTKFSLIPHDMQYDPQTVCRSSLLDRQHTALHMATEQIWVRPVRSSEMRSCALSDVSKYLVCFWRNSPPSGATASSLTRFLDHTRRHTTVGRTPLDEWSAENRDLYLTKHNTQQTNVHAPLGIRTHNPSRRAVANPRLRSRGHWDQLLSILVCSYSGSRGPMKWPRLLF